ncbi:aminodeoxychorismate synthase, subunit I [Palleronia marisminoris]|uniref:Aminodeoxychorismate synthase component 1 n=1 Tax=Palleronia marisminoris TaxID=315423 RepID=A0A1Y5R7Q2_9RHOB|nr:aminodeoxychorismate synthase component I [Palleronia marisminoris]SFG05727.1 aminodeoxychorismate synthase, subunit I [Palleronia marisminoris]SLN10450.1 Aminodeoxychorismate synthase component 1 [Palleronia marisminoris]
MHVTFDEGPLGTGTRFADPVRLIEAHAAADVLPAFEAIEAERRAGRWLAGYVSYEAGYVFSHKLAHLMPAERDVPLLSFGVFEGPEPKPCSASGAASLTDLVPRWSAARYETAFARVQDYISAGDIYQANLTFPIDAHVLGTPAELYAALAVRQPVRHGALIELGGPAILCRSPELFFDIDPSGLIRTRPMKGTAPRGATPEADAALRTDLAESEKNRAENLMIVDLLRNDIGRISQVGSVRVPRLFHVETYETLHQMVSDVEGQLRADIGIPEIFEALFPCGSITGAPKIRAMQILAELETGPRGVYCGAVGWIAPNGGMRMGVAIRTLTVRPDGRARLDVGGGVVHDSTGAGEYEEALWKARFATLPPG